MNIKIQAKHMDLTEAIENYVNKKIGSLEKFIADEQSIVCDVEIGKTTNHHRSGDIFRAELNMILPGYQVYAVSEKEDLYSAIDVVRDEAERILTTQKTKKVTVLRRAAQRIKDSIKNLRRA